VPSFADIVLDKSLKQSFQYLIPEKLESILKIGQFVKIPFGKAEEIGVIVGFSQTPVCDIKRIKKIADLINHQIIVPDDILKMTQWISEYYECSWGEAIFAGTPSTIRKKNLKFIKAISLNPAIQDEPTHEKQKEITEFLKTQKNPVPVPYLLGKMQFSGSSLKTLLQQEKIILTKVEDGFQEELPDFIKEEKESPLILNDEQVSAVNSITKFFNPKSFKVFLLHGITGSGKTEVYLQAIKQCIEQGKQAIVLVPEISLTPQTVGRFKNRFDRIAVMHSSLTEVNRLSEWRKIQMGEIDIVVGARSAIFAPLTNIGVIIVDEEHDSSYKQDRTPRYNARDLAIVRGKSSNAAVILGSATPSLDSWANTKNGKYELISLKKRAGLGLLPTFHIIDLKNEVVTNRKFEIFADYLLQELKENLKNKMQSIVFINRKGFYPHLSCKKCKETVKCKGCDIRLTVYKDDNFAACNYCGYKIKIPKSCPTCGHHEILFRGYGTERVTDILQLLIPEARILRMDAKTMSTTAKHEKAYNDFKSHQFDILVGTQMIAKGLDFPKVTLVGILQIDASLSFLDFRMAEKTYQIISQVSGRAGRAENPGKVVIQTFSPEHYVIECAAETNFKTFAQKELENRSMLFYPPYSRLVKFLFKSKNEEKLSEYINIITPHFKQIAQEEKVNCLGPAPAGIEKLEYEFRQQFLIKADAIKSRKAFIQKAIEFLKPVNGISYIIDVDPQTTL
jgi:primosomal protein N' (replication factor Y)